MLGYIGWYDGEGMFAPGKRISDISLKSIKEGITNYL